jgi:hypothetical protein
MKTLTTVVWAAALLTAGSLAGHEPVTRARTEINLPDIPGYVTLKCDFHIHTVFSDGQVWPTVRAEEAWRQGLDAIAITDHIEYQPHKVDVSTNRNRSYEIARPAGASLDVLVVRGSEITRKMPPGHLNAIFLTNSTLLVVSNWHEAISEAHRQGAFIFWNHPGWDAQLVDNRVQWFPEHTQILEEGMLHGIEVVNGRDYYPEAHRWAVEKKLAMLSNSDVHAPLNLDYYVHEGDHRPVTLVFAAEQTAAALREALFNRQTAVYSADRLIGEERWLRPIFTQSIRIKKPKLEIKGKEHVNVQISNHSDLDYQLERAGELAEVAFPKTLTLAAGKIVVLEIQGKAETTAGQRQLQLPYKVANLLVAPDQPLAITLDLEAKFNPTTNAAK